MYIVLLTSTEPVYTTSNLGVSVDEAYEELNPWLDPEEVRHGDVTAGVKRAWNVITADKYSFFYS